MKMPKLFPLNADLVLFPFRSGNMSTKLLSYDETRGPKGPEPLT